MNDGYVCLTGNLTRDPELSYTPSGAPVAKFSLAVNRRWQSNGEWQEATSFFDIICWKPLAENVAESLHKGDRIIVTGRLEQRSWDARDGSGKRSAIEVTAEEVGPSLRFATAVAHKAERTGGERMAGNRQADMSI